jgi:hypothetical protein
LALPGNSWTAISETGKKFGDGTGGSGYILHGQLGLMGDIIGIALDLDAGTPTVTFYKNNATQGVAFTFTGIGSIPSI